MLGDDLDYDGSFDLILGGEIVTLIGEVPGGRPIYPFHKNFGVSFINLSIEIPLLSRTWRRLFTK